MNRTLLLILFSIVAFAINSLSVRIFQLKISSNRRDTDLFQGFYCLIAALAYWVASGFQYTLSPIALIQAITFGLFFASACFFSAVCYECGPMSVTNVIINASVVIPVLVGCVLYKEAIGPAQLIGCLLLAATFIISAAGTKDDHGVNKLWLILVIIAFFSNGFTAVIQKMYKLSALESDGNMFMGIAYLTATIVFFLLALTQRKPPHATGKLHLPAYYPLLVGVAGLGSFAGNGVLITLSTQVPASILYPFVNGGLSIAVSIVSCVALKEKLTKRNLLAILVGLCAIVVLNL